MGIALTGYIVSIPIFVDSAFVILCPVSKALAKKGNRSILTLGISLAGGLVVTHTMVPPTPGPLGAAGLFGVDVGAMMLLGMALAIPCVIGIVFYAQWIGTKYSNVDNHDETDEKLKAIQNTYLTEKARPSIAKADGISSSNCCSHPVDFYQSNYWHNPFAFHWPKD